MILEDFLTFGPPGVGGPGGGRNGPQNRGILGSLEIGKVQKPYIFLAYFQKVPQLHGWYNTKTGSEMGPRRGARGARIRTFREIL